MAVLTTWTYSVLDLQRLTACPAFEGLPRRRFVLLPFLTCHRLGWCPGPREDENEQEKSQESDRGLDENLSARTRDAPGSEQVHQHVLWSLPFVIFPPRERCSRKGRGSSLEGPEILDASISQAATHLCSANGGPQRKMPNRPATYQAEPVEYSLSCKGSHSDALS